MARRGLWFGFLLGFLFGIPGLWLLSLLSLLFQWAEAAFRPLFEPARALAAWMVRDGSANNLEVLVLFLFNGVLYGLVGMGIQWVVRRGHLRAHGRALPNK